jgi:ferredoxin/DNA-binding MarR family transcriptional regulator
MPPADLYERLCRFYELMVGTLPLREEFRAALEETIAEDDLRAFFLLPLSGPTPLEKLARRAGREGLTEEQVRGMLDRLAAQGFIIAYEGPHGPTYERGNVIFLTEQQVRKLEDCPRRTVFARFFDQAIEIAGRNLPTKTPYFRVLPVEGTLKRGAPRRTVIVDEVIPDPRGVLPIDVISEMVRQTRLIGVAECYCRKTKRILGQGCEHPLETCMVFNELAETLIGNGFARQATYEEAMEIIWRCEGEGLVHNVDNCQGAIRALCNCCSCCCAVLKSWQRGQRNAGGASRYVAAFDAAKCRLVGACVSVCPSGARRLEDGRVVVDPSVCLGCGLCVAACPEGANRLVPREPQPRIPRTNPELYGKIGREALLGMVKRKVLG